MVLDTEYQNCHTYLLSWHGFWVHDILLDDLTHFCHSQTQDFPQRRLAGAAGTHHYHSHPLPQLFIQLQSFLHLLKNHQLYNPEVEKKKYFLLHSMKYNRFLF